MSLEHIIEQKLTRERYAHVGVILGAAIGATNYVLTKDTEQSNQIAQVVGNYAIQGAGLGYCIGYIKSMYDEFKERFRN